jgi:hypothetical protein
VALAAIRAAVVVLIRALAQLHQRLELIDRGLGHAFVAWSIHAKRLLDDFISRLDTIDAPAYRTDGHV